MVHMDLVEKTAKYLFWSKPTLFATEFVSWNSCSNVSWESTFDPWDDWDILWANTANKKNNLHCILYKQEWVLFHVVQYIYKTIK